MFEKLKRAIKALSEGKFIMVYDQDNREAEVDLVVLAEKVTSNHVYHLRHDAGGLICIAMANEISKAIELPFMLDIYNKISNIYSVFNHCSPDAAMPYGDKPSFSITINHINTYTGITDNDRALTISEFGKLGCEIINNGSNINKYKKVFGSNFRAPGHTHLLIAAKGLLAERKGHTELTVSLAVIGNKMLGLDITPCTVLCEMLDGTTGKALSLEKAKQYAKENNIAMINGKEITEAFEYIMRAQ
ncbi:MAG: 3,4-dihydroxy-2-butanone-4-phosphate synthase [Candidatus Helarchaeota archaeon]|nr:3,4-dihydroxy-2-butanone-4-phosphate synthase [Candidatus Helarchaeota archaeon]